MFRSPSVIFALTGGDDPGGTLAVSGPGLQKVRSHRRGIRGFADLVNLAIASSASASFSSFFVRLQVDHHVHHVRDVIDEPPLHLFGDPVPLLDG